LEQVVKVSFFNKINDVLTVNTFKQISQRRDIEQTDGKDDRQWTIE